MQIYVSYIIILHAFVFDRTPINYLLVNLAVADIMFAVFITPKIVSSLFFAVPDGLTGTVLCKFLIGGNIAWFAVDSSIVTITVIAIERYYAVVYPLNNTGTRLTKRKLKVRPVLFLLFKHMSIKNLKFHRSVA